MLLMLGGAGLAGCSSAGTPEPPPASPTRAPRPSRSATGVALPPVRRWVPSPADVAPACKLAAVRLVERRGNGASTALEVVDAQYGGFLTDSASVLVVCRSWRLAHGSLAAGGHTYDVRLSRTSAGAWQVTAVHPSRPGPPAARSAAARRVLASDRIDLPPAARADIASGRVHDSVLTAMLGLARSYRIGVSVVRSGHPIHVFGTQRLSDHPRGRAFDTWRIDGHAIVDPATPKRLVDEYMHTAAEAGSYNVGGPYLLAGSGNQYFSDATHHDHVHTGFTA